MAFGVGGVSAYGAVGAVGFGYSSGAPAAGPARPSYYSPGQARQALTAEFQLQATWGGFLGSNYNYPTQWGGGNHYGGGGGFSFGNGFSSAPSAVTGALFQNQALLNGGFAEIGNGFGTISPFGQSEVITGPLGFGSLFFPPSEFGAGSPVFRSDFGPQGLFATNYAETVLGTQNLGFFGATPAFQRFGGFPSPFGGMPAGGLAWGGQPNGIFAPSFPPFFG